MGSAAMNEAINDTPIDSANNPIHSKEEIMGTNTVAMSAVAGSSASTELQPASAAPTVVLAPPPKKEPPPKKVRKLHDPARSLARARKVLDRAEGNSDPEVMAAADTVNRRVAGLKAADKLIVATKGAEENAAHALRAADVTVADALAPAASFLKERIPGGKATYAMCKSPAALVTGRKLIERVAASRLAIGAHLMNPLRSAVEQAQAPEKELQDAKKRAREAKAAYVTARLALEAALPVVTSTVAQKRVVERALKIGARLQARTPKETKKKH